MEIRKAKLQDSGIIHELANSYASKGKMLPRSLSSIFENIRDFFVCENDGFIVGCAALHVCWQDLAEIKTLGVRPDFTGKGIGRKLVQSCLDEASSMDINKVFCLTFIPEFFESFGFKKINKEKLPKKIWSDCVNCPKFPDCSEIALIYEVK
jgi:amino-acid N-acetyltransferase